MPIYEFRCPKCQRVFDVFRQRAEAGQAASCPDDGTEGQRIFSAAVLLGESPGATGLGEEELAGLTGGMGGDDFGGDFGGMDEDFDF